MSDVRPVSDASTVQLPGSFESSEKMGHGSTLGREASGSRAPWLAEPERLGRLEIVRCIGAGGMGEVYEAHDAELDRRVAVKLVRSDITSRDATARIVREAQLMARITHANVVRLYDVGRIDGRVYITMEYVQGVTLSGWLDQARRPWREVVECFLKAGRGLAAAHVMGLVHRDFKPANVLIGDDGRVLVADFGLARSLGADSGETTTSDGSVGPTSSASLLPVTVYGTVLGTPGYMSPEQLLAAPVDARSDVFSFCVALYEALFGFRPFAGANTAELLADIGGGVRPPPRRGPKVPERISRALVRGLAAEPARRFSTMHELLGELEAGLRRSRWLVGAGVAAAALLVTAGAAADVGPFADADPCATAGSDFTAVWSERHKQALRAGFEATQLSFAAGAAERVGERLDAYAAAGRQAGAEACEAALVRHEQSPVLFDLRMACLERREAALRSLVDALLVADAGMVQAAVDSTATLPAMALCSDVDALIRTAAPPEDPAVAAAVDEAREVMARAEAQRVTGRYQEGLALADEAALSTATIDHEPVRAEALALRGRVLADIGDLVGAEAALLDAVELAEASRHDELAADVWIELMRLANLSLVDPARGATWIRRARAAQRRLGDSPARRVRVLGEQGTLHSLELRHAESEKLFRAALALEEEHGGDPLVLARLTHNLANALDAQDRDREARAAFDRARAEMEYALGPDHPELARVLYDHGASLLVLGELDEGQAQLEAALALTTRAHGPAHHVNGRAHIALVQVALSRGDFAGAVAHADAAKQIYGNVLPARHLDHVYAAIACGTARFFAGELEAALAEFTAAQALEADLGWHHPDVRATIAVDIAETQLALARPEPAREAFDAAAKIAADAGLTDVDLSARVLTGRGKLALLTGEFPAALSALEEALALRRQLPEDPLALEEVYAAIAEAKAGMLK